MKKYSFLVHHSEYVDFLQDLRRLGVLHVHLRQAESSEELQKELERQKAIRETLRALSQRRVEPAGEAVVDENKGMEIVQVYEQLNDTLEKRKQELQALEKEIEFWQPWGSFSLHSLARLQEAGLEVRFFICPVKKFNSQWSETYPLEVINILSPDCYFVAIAPADEPLQLDAEEIPPPEKNLDELLEKREVLKKQIESIQDSLDHQAATGLASLEAALHTSEGSTQLIQVVESTQREVEGAVMLLEGFAPIHRQEEIDGFCAARSIPFLKQQPRPEDAPPVLLKNGRFPRLFEPIGKLFALPSYQELDLTPYFAPFFMLFFGFCLGDAGYGLLLLLGASLYKPRAGKEWKPILSLAQFLGLATILFGILTGTLFGINLLDERYAFLGDFRSIMLDSNQVFQLALFLGLAQILFGLFIKALNQIRQFGLVYSIATFGWIILLLSLLDLALLKRSGPVAPISAWAGVGLILLFNDPKAGLLGRLGKGIWELYGITGIFGDLLSYIRLFALGISSAILGFVVNDIAVQIREGIPYLGPLFFVLFLLVGHGLNLLIASLGAFVHPMRLTFVEFYKNAGFSGGGKAYQPFSTDQKNPLS